MRTKTLHQALKDEGRKYGLTSIELIRVDSNDHASFGEGTEAGYQTAYVYRRLYTLSRELGRRNPDAQHHGALGGEWGYGQFYSNAVFEMNPWTAEDCTCGGIEAERECSNDCPQGRPNFRCGDYEIRWYKAIGRSMSANQALPRRALQRLFKACFNSLTDVARLT